LLFVADHSLRRNEAVHIPTTKHRHFTLAKTMVAHIRKLFCNRNISLTTNYVV